MPLHWDYISNRAPSFNSRTLHPLNKEEKLHSAIANIDFWNPQPEAFELFILKMKKAWSQKKFRDKQGDRKTYSFSLRPSNRELLKQLALEKNCKPNELIEHLIDSLRRGEIQTHYNTEDIASQLQYAERELAGTKQELEDCRNEIDKLKRELETTTKRQIGSQPSTF